MYQKYIAPERTWDHYIAPGKDMGQKISPSHGQTDNCENIPFSRVRLRAVKIYILAAVVHVELDDAIDDGVLFDDVTQVAMLALPP